MDELSKVLWQLTIFTWKLFLFMVLLVLGIIAGIFRAKV